MRAVLDTNVLVRMILARRPEGVAGALFEQLIHRGFELVMSEPLLQELSETLLAPHLVARHGWTAPRIERYVALLRSHAVVVTAGTTLVSLPTLEERDPDDVALIRAGVEGRADCIVSQDADLLDLHHFEAMEMLDPLAFLQRLRAQERTRESDLDA